MFVADSHPSRVELLRGHAAGARLRARLRRLPAATACVVGLIAAVGSPGALAADPQHNHFREVGTDVDPDFCGTGQQIDVAFNVLFNEWLAPNKADFKQTATAKFTLTNPLTGDTVITRVAGPTTVVNASGDPEGIHDVLVTVTGLPQMIKPVHGGVLIFDAGYALIRQTFDGEEFISAEVVLLRGPHPDLESDFELGCQLAIEALGL